MEIWSRQEVPQGPWSVGRSGIHLGKWFEMLSQEAAGPGGGGADKSPPWQGKPLKGHYHHHLSAGFLSLALLHEEDRRLDQGTGTEYGEVHSCGGWGWMQVVRIPLICIAYDRCGGGVTLDQVQTLNPASDLTRNLCASSLCVGGLGLGACLFLLSLPSS